MILIYTFYRVVAHPSLLSPATTTNMNKGENKRATQKQKNTVVLGSRLLSSALKTHRTSQHPNTAQTPGSANRSQIASSPQILSIEKGFSCVRATHRRGGRARGMHRGRPGRKSRGSRGRHAGDGGRARGRARRRETLGGRVRRSDCGASGGLYDNTQRDERQ